jgi:hypothetical protein
VQVTGEWANFCNEELHNLHTAPDVIKVIVSRRMRCAGHTARMGDMRNAYKLLVGKAEGRTPLDRRRCRWVKVKGEVIHVL